MLINDSAFKRTDDSALACKGHLLALMQAFIETPAGRAHWLQGSCKRHKRVNRSTYAAELNGLSDGLEPAKLMALMLTEIINGVCSAGALKTTLEEAR